VNHGRWEWQVGPYTTIHQNNRWVKSTVKRWEACLSCRSLEARRTSHGAPDSETLFSKTPASDKHWSSCQAPSTLTLEVVCMVINLLWTLPVWLLQRFLIACDCYRQTKKRPRAMRMTHYNKTLKFAAWESNTLPPALPKLCCLHLCPVLHRLSSSGCSLSPVPTEEEFAFKT
jgi:hypothetical protein